MEFKKRKTQVKEDESLTVDSPKVITVEELDLLISVYGKKILYKRNLNGNTIFHEVCINDELKTFVYLHRNGGIDFEVLNKQHNTAFEVACLSGSEKCLTYMMNTWEYDKEIRSCLNLGSFYAIVITCSVEFIRKFIDKFKNVLVKSWDMTAQNVLFFMLTYSKPVCMEVRKKIISTFKYIVETTNLDKNYISANSCIVIRCILEGGFIELLEYLKEIDSKIEWKYCDENGVPMLMHFFERKFYSYRDLDYANSDLFISVPLLCKFLKSQPYIKYIWLGGSDVTIYEFLINQERPEYIPWMHEYFEEDLILLNDEGDSILIQLCKRSLTEHVKELLKNKNLDVNTQNDKGETALMVCCRDIDKTRVLHKLLYNLHYKIDFTLKNKEGDTALMIAQKIGNDEAVASLLKNM